MWRISARKLLQRSLLRRHSPIQTHVSPKTLTLPPPPAPGRQISPKWPLPTSSYSQTPRCFSSNTVSSFDFKEDDHEIHGNGPSGDSPDLISQEPGGDAGSGGSSSWNFKDSDASPISVSEESGDPSLHFNDDKDNMEDGGDSLSSLWDQTVGDDPTDIFESKVVASAEPVEIDEEQLQNVVSLLQGTLQEPLATSLDNMYLALSEEFVVRVIGAPEILAENLVGFFKWAIEYNESVKTSNVIEHVICSLGASADLTKKEAYVVWDLMKESGKEKGLMTTGSLNQLISIFWKLQKAKAGLEVFDKFAEFGCDLDSDTYYLTVQALGTRYMYDAAWSVCWKMLKSERFPDGDKIGEIIILLCKADKPKEAHLVYSKAKEKEMKLPRSCLDILIGNLSRKGKCIRTALELLEDYSGESVKYANKTFSLVIRNLCRFKDFQEAKKLLLRMVDSGPPPGSAAFNYVITAFAKEGDLEDALALVKVLESRGLRPDVYTYTVIMSGFAKGGLMDEAYKIFCEAKKKHPKLAPATYHVLTRGYCKMEQFDKALGCLKEMKEDGLHPNTDEYNKMIQSLCLKAVDWRAAEKLLEEMEKSGLRLNRTTCSLIAAVKELEQEEIIPPEGFELESA